jgi:hypothetical protein
MQRKISTSLTSEAFLFFVLAASCAVFVVLHQLFVGLFGLMLAVLSLHARLALFIERFVTKKKKKSRVLVY